ncbi:MAG: GNAT family N-acetyltransferase [Motilibacteraceae bacterium]
MTTTRTGLPDVDHRPHGTAERPSGGWSVRTIHPDEWPAYARLGELAFLGETTPEELELERSVHELDRSLGAYDGELLVGSAAAYTFDLTVPGGRVPAAGVTWVSVAPTHRRRGVLSALMRHQLDGIHAAGQEPVAVLWASEAGIYGRYGYGRASWQLSFEVPRSPAAVLAATDPGLRVRLVDPEESLDVCAGVYDAVRATRPGFYARDARWHRRELFDAPSFRGGQSRLRVALVEDEQGTARAYARYRTEARWSGPGGPGPQGVVHVREAKALDAAAYAALLRYLSDLDLTATLSLQRRPVDDPALDLLADPRRARPVLGDALYVRLVGLPAALAARTYRSEVDVVVEVVDEQCPWNAGRWRLSAGAGGASCEPTSEPADLALPVAVLGAAYLGSARALSRAAAAGRVKERTSGAVLAADRAFTGDVEPWCPTVF